MPVYDVTLSWLENSDNMTAQVIIRIKADSMWDAVKKAQSLVEGGFKNECIRVIFLG